MRQRSGGAFRYGMHWPRRSARLLSAALSETFPLDPPWTATPFTSTDKSPEPQSSAHVLCPAHVRLKHADTTTFSFQSRRPQRSLILESFRGADASQSPCPSALSERNTYHSDD
ncbi:hypothetical protein AAFF_G00213940 [Aldrovandia affinis]|uniref:Uncharacterized protein n=1 Tax=Aldrovandia affinis TaxID=143900 RepID=A0AAD7RGN0_9TELE|nr:hypothetical protein AAFF_G00213940 [Aldrovandia affinis]